jgi:predicted MFS family arabinose efflux permease
MSERWWLPVLVLACGTFASGTDGFVIAGILPSIARDLAVSIAVAGQMVTAFAFAYALGSPVLMTFVAGRSSPKRLLAGAMGAFAAANVLAALAPNAGLLAFARVLAALLAGVYVPTAAASAAMLVGPELRGRALALVLGGASVATALGVPAGVWIEAHSSWRATFAFVSVLAVLALGGILFALPALPSLPKVPLRARLAPRARAAVRLVLGVTLLAMTAGFSIYTYAGPVFGQPGAVGARWLGLLLFVFGCGSVVGSWFGGYGADRWGAVQTLAVGLTIFTANFALLSLSARSLPAACAFMFVWGVVGWGFVPPQQHRLIRLAPQSAPVVLSLNASAMYLGIAAGAAVGGAVAARAGAGSLWLVATACAGSSVIVVIVPQLAASWRAASAAAERGL